MLARVADVVGRGRVLVSFNGKRFDVDRLLARYHANGLPSPFDALPHIDLLPLSRSMIPGQRRYNLGSLEENLLGFVRVNDVPGKDIPPLWKRYLRSNDASLLDGVLEHNRWDIVSMTALLAHLIEAKANPAPATPKEAAATPAPNPSSPVGARIARSYALKDRSGPTGSTRPSTAPATTPVSLGDYLKNLREKSQSLINGGRFDEALPLLHEMVALAPHHPYALEFLVSHHRTRGEKHLVELYEARLKRGSPF
jgi:hypothetical protein